MCNPNFNQQVENLEFDNADIINPDDQKLEFLGFSLQKLMVLQVHMPPYRIFMFNKHLDCIRLL